MAPPIPPCDHTSVGMLTWQGDSLLFIERNREPFGWAPPAGHVDESASYEDAAIRELHEETGLSVSKMRLVYEARKANPCRRPGGTWHSWKVFRVEPRYPLETRRAEAEVKRMRWLGKGAVAELLHRTQAYSAGDIDALAWSRNPGLEPVWADIFNDMRLMYSGWPME